MTVSTKYLLFHTSGDKNSGDLWKITSKGPKIYSKKDMAKKKYPKPLDDMQDFYLTLKIEPVTAPEFKNVKWDFKKIDGYSTGRASAFPFTTNIIDLMKHKVK